MSADRRDSVNKQAEQLLVATSLLAALDQTRGAPPSGQELEAFVEQRLVVDRHSEVESYIAHDPEVFQRYMAVLAKRRQSPALALHGTPVPAFTRLQRFLFGDRGWGHWSRPALAMLSVVGIVVGFGLTGGFDQQQPDLVTGGSTPAIADVANPVNRQPPGDWQATAFARGYRNPSLLGRVFTAPSQAFNAHCGDSAPCESLVDQLSAFGAAVANAQRSCDKHAVLSAADINAITQLSLAERANRRWSVELTRLQTAARTSPRQACRAVQALASRYGPTAY